MSIDHLLYFYYYQSDKFKTTISIMDYWTPKRSMDVMIICSLRTMDGELLERKMLSFDLGRVINYEAPIDGKFEGSVEIEVFASKNMVIPYAAIMAVYEDENSISMCHSYGRVYSLHEMEEKRTIPIGEEGCWTIRDNKDIRSFGVFHNGYGTQEAQTIVLEATNHKNEKLVVEHQLKELKPYSTVKLVPQEIIGDKLIQFLEGQPGNMSLSYNLNGAFTRMLVGNETNTEFQVTHSNFNYSKHETDKAGEGSAYMHIPEAGFKDYELIIYPDCSPGNYTVTRNAETVAAFSDGQRAAFPVSNGIIKISSENNIVPSRIVTGLAAKPAKEKSQLHYECSLGIIHKMRPLKSTFWGLVSIEENLESRLFIVAMDSIYGKNPDTSLTIKLYIDYSQEPLEYTLNEQELENASKGLYISKLFPQIKEAKSRFAWYYLRSESYGGFQTYSTIESDKGSLTMEHSF